MKNIEPGFFLDDFKVEASIHVEQIEAAFLDVESLAGNADLINHVFRDAHSLKGTSGFFSLDKIVAVSHALESVFSKLRDGSLDISDDDRKVTERLRLAGELLGIRLDDHIIVADGNFVSAY